MVRIFKEIEEIEQTLVEWRRDLHAHPELAFEEHRTSKFVAEKLREFNIEVEENIAGTGVVGTLRRGSGNLAVGLRADLDALPIQEENDFNHKSKNVGKMHACGHDGHTTMLLGAAQYLANHGKFSGTVHFIFQPAEENEGGGKAMIEDGLFERFPVNSIFGMHNIPGIPVGSFAIKPGAMMAAFDIFELTISGQGGHAAMPHLATDPIQVGTKIVEAFQNIVAKEIDPQEPAVLSVTKFQAGDAYNVIPTKVKIGGCTRCFSEKVQGRLETRMRHLSKEIANAFDAKCDFFYERRYPPTINNEEETQLAAKAAINTVGKENLISNHRPSMGSEDFAFMLRERPGAYIWIGNGDGEGSCMIHNPSYDFNDKILKIGASWWVRLAEQYLSPP